MWLQTEKRFRQLHLAVLGVLQFQCVFQSFQDWHARIRDVAAKLLQEIVVKAWSFFGHQEMSRGPSQESSHECTFIYSRSIVRGQFVVEFICSYQYLLHTLQLSASLFQPVEEHCTIMVESYLRPVLQKNILLLYRTSSRTWTSRLSSTAVLNFSVSTNYWFGFGGWNSGLVDERKTAFGREDDRKWHDQHRLSQLKTFKLWVSSAPTSQLTSRIHW